MTAPAKSIYVDPDSIAGQLRAALDAIVWRREADWTAARALLDTTRTSNEGMTVAGNGTVSDAAFWDDLLGDDTMPAHLDYGHGAPPAAAAPAPIARFGGTALKKTCTRRRRSRRRRRPSDLREARAPAVRRQTSPQLSLGELGAIERAIHAALAAPEDPDEDVEPR